MQLRIALQVEAGDIVTFTGAGGKTTAICRLSQELLQAGLRVIVTTTTRLGLDQLDLFPCALVNPTAAEIEQALAHYGALCLVKAVDPQQGKATGLSNAEVAALTSYADVILVEGDGAKGRALKAPATHEPVIPEQSSHVVTVTGLWAIGRPLTAEIAHRPALIAELTGLRMGDPITANALIRLLLHPAGPARGAPASARRHVLLNGLDHFGSAEESSYRQEEIGSSTSIPFLAQRLGSAGQFHAALIGQVAQPSPVFARYGKVAAIVLAAGAATRFGGVKQLHPWQGEPLLRHVVMQTLAAPVSEVLVVLGAHVSQIAPSLAGLPVTIIHHRDWQNGQSTSLKAGLRACHPLTSAALFVLGDQPHLPAELLNAIVNGHRHRCAPIIAPTYQGQRGNPVLFDQVCFPDLYRLTGDTGGRALFRRYEHDIHWLAAGPEILHDIDEPGDLDNSLPFAD